MTTDRDRLVASVAAMRMAASGIMHPSVKVIAQAGDAAEAWVSALVAEPDKPVQCPCCTKQVTLCVKHYALHEPGKKCSACREDE